MRSDRIGVAGIALAVGALVGTAACANDGTAVEPGGTVATAPQEAALTVSELLEQRPATEALVRGSIYAEGYEYFGEDEIGWEYEVSLCDSVSLSGDQDDPWITCEGSTVDIGEEVLSLDLDWEFADFGLQYTDEVVVRGVLGDDDDLQVLEVTESDDRAPVVVTTEGRGTGTSSSTGTVPAQPLPIDELPGEDLYGLRTHLRTPGVVPIYLGSRGFVERVQQLRANCETQERLQLIIDNLSSRGPEAPQDFVDQHVYVCRELVQKLTVIDGVELPT